MSTSNKSAIFRMLPRSGWEELVHYLDTVEGVLPAVPTAIYWCAFSTNTNLIQFISLYLPSNRVLTAKVVKTIQFHELVFIFL